MATTETHRTIPLDDFDPSSSACLTWHRWVRHDRHGGAHEVTYVLAHADRNCPVALPGGGAFDMDGPGSAEPGEPWPCSTCYVWQPGSDRAPNGGRHDSIDAPDPHPAGPSRGEEPPSEPQLRLLLALCRAAALRANADEDETLDAETLEGLAAAAAETAGASRIAASRAIDAAKERGLAPVWTPITEHDPRVVVERHPTEGLRTNRYASTCAACGGQVAAEGGWLTKGATGWEVRHQGTCPAAPAAAPAVEPGERYEPTKGDVHVLDDEYYRVHVSQSSGRPYGAVWNGRKFVGAVHDERARGSLRRMSRATLATAEQAAAFGHMNHRCCFCSTPIDTPESEAVGYGPKCAADRGLPWGEA